MATFNFFYFLCFCTLLVLKKKVFVCCPSLVQKLKCRKKNQNEGKNKLYNHTKLAMYVFFFFFVCSFFPLSIKVNVIATQMQGSNVYLSGGTSIRLDLKRRMCGVLVPQCGN